jgi:hypothetical protein
MEKAEMLLGREPGWIAKVAPSIIQQKNRKLDGGEVGILK